MSNLRRKFVVCGFSPTGSVRRGSLLGHELRASADWHGAIFEPGGPVRSRRIHKPTLERAAASGAASEPERGTIVASPPAGGADASPLIQPVGGAVARTARLARVCALGPSASRAGCAHAQRISLTRRSNRPASDQRHVALALDRTGGGLVPCRSSHRRDRFAGVVRWLQKKET
jgi:hypothetical protein